MRHLALDVGDERIGVAISDGSGLLARPLEMIHRLSGASSFLRIVEIVNQEKIETIIVGLPLLPNGSEGEQVRSTQAYVSGLETYVSVPIVYWDEGYSTERASGISDENRSKQSLDAIAAAVILQDYLDNGNREASPRE